MIWMKILAWAEDASGGMVIGGSELGEGEGVEGGGLTNSLASWEKVWMV